MVDTSDPVFRTEYEKLARANHERLSRLLDRLEVAHVDIDTSQGYVRPLRQFFKQRANVLRRGG